MGTFNAMLLEKLVGGIINDFYVIAILLVLGIITSQFILPNKKISNHIKNRVPEME